MILKTVNLIFVVEYELLLELGLRKYCWLLRYGIKMILESDLNFLFKFDFKIFHLAIVEIFYLVVCAAGYEIFGKLRPLAFQGFLSLRKVENPYFAN